MNKTGFLLARKHLLHRNIQSIIGDKIKDENIKYLPSKNWPDKGLYKPRNLAAYKAGEVNAYKAT